MAEEEEEKSSKKSSYVAAGATAGNIVSMPLMVMSGNPLAVMTGVSAGSTGAISGSYVMKQEKVLQGSSSLRDLVSNLKNQEGKLKEQNKRLKEQVLKLRQAVGRIKEVEHGLRAMAEAQGSDMNRLMELVEENRETIEKMKKLMTGKICQNIVSIVLKCDDGDGIFDGRETDLLCLRLNNIEGVDFYENEMRTLITENNGSVKSVMSVVQNLLKPGNGPKIFGFEIEDSDDELM